MSTVTWSTPRGNLGTIPESQYYSLNFLAVDNDEQPLFYSLISGTLPPGMYVTRDGYLRGIPVLDSNTDKTSVFSFSVRATNPDYVVSDRSFYLTVSNNTGPSIILAADLIGAWFDGNFLEYQFEYTNDNPNTVPSFKVLTGDLPPGISLSSSGNLSGFVDIIAAPSSYLGYEEVGIDEGIFDPKILSTDRYYNFKVQITDGIKFDTKNVVMLIVSKGNFSADNSITLINNTFITIDADNKYRPVILNSPETLPTLVSGDTFAYRFIGYDPEGEDISWEIDELAFSGMDDLDSAISQSLICNGTPGPYTLGQSPDNAARITIRVNDVLLTAYTDYDTAGDQLTFTYFSISSITRSTNLVTVTAVGHTFNQGDTINVVGVTDTSFNGSFTVTSKTSSTVTYAQIGSNASSSGGTLSKYAPTVSDTVEVLFIDVNTGFDTLLFDQGASGLPAGLSINATTGWIFGVLPAQVEEFVTYTFRITAFRTINSSYRSDTVSFDLTVQRTLNEEIVWTSPEDLGYIDNGAVSELAIGAYNTLGKELKYSIIYEPYKKIPQGLKFLPSGRFTGRTTFRYFALDGTSAQINLLSTENLVVDMQVQGPGVSSGCKITAILSPTAIEVRPAIYVEQGVLLTFSNLDTVQVSSTTSNAVSTAIDGGATTFDQLSRFTVKAETIDGTSSAIKAFKVLVLPYNLAPYENVYLKSLTSERQRNLFKSITDNKTVFPDSLIYRPDDPNFGVTRSFKFLFLPGLSPSTAATFIDAIQYNHYDKIINFGEIKTAVSKDSSGNIVYEVVYVDVVDSQQYDTAGPGLELIPNIANGYLYEGQEYKIVYPNSFNNMQTRIENSIGYANRGALPNWMLSVQDNGLVLGLTRAIVMAYVKPGASKLVAYRLKNSLENNTANFSFVADRYQWDNYLSQYYNTVTATFEPSVQTTFDKYTNPVGSGDTFKTTITSAVTDSNIINIPLDISVGYGWLVSSQDINSSIAANVQINNVNGSTLTLSSTVTATAGAVIKISGETKVDYAVSVPFNYINNTLLSVLRNSYYVDGTINFIQNETIVFKIQEGFGNVENDGWVDENGDIVPGYLEKLTDSAVLNKRGGAWRITWNPMDDIGFDSDVVGFDGEAGSLNNSYFDQGGDSEVRLKFVNEVLFNQQVYVRTGRTYPNSVMTYTTETGSSVPEFITVNTTVRTAETTFDGGTCCVRERDIQRGAKAIRGGTNFSTNRDIYIKPETKDKYIKFPQNGVFV